MTENAKKLFVLSDVHGFFTPMKTALDAAGYDPDDESHLLIFCGDMFDRGTENTAVFDYFSGLKNKILIRGNHDERLVQLLATRQLDGYDFYNGTAATLTEFFGDGCVDENGRLHIPDEAFAEKLRELYLTERDYYEFGDYIFTHGWLPSAFYGSTPYLAENWAYADQSAWSAARWMEWQRMYPARETAAIPGKTIVCGHRPASFGYMFDRSRSANDCGIFYGDGVIAIDGRTVWSGIVNVLVSDAKNENR